MTGYSIVARQCEYLYTPAAKVHHHLTAKEGVQFTIIVNGISRLINAAQVGPFNLDQVTMCFVTVRDAKNDAEGAGNRFPFRKLDLEFVDTQAAFCLCTELFLLAKRTTLRPSSPIFSSPADRENWALSAEVLNFHMRRVASEGFGIHSNKISTRSLRIGAASALANAKVPDYIIQKVGRWKSLVFLQYIRLARGSFEVAQSALLNRSNFNIDDVRHWHPGAVHLLQNVVPKNYIDDDDTTVGSLSANEYWPPL